MLTRGKISSPLIEVSVATLSTASTESSASAQSKLDSWNFFVRMWIDISLIIDVATNLYMVSTAIKVLNTRDEL
jgi:hypothetical protein